MNRLEWKDDCASVAEFRSRQRAARARLHSAPPRPIARIADEPWPEFIFALSPEPDAKITKPITVAEIKASVAGYFDMRVSEFSSERRGKSLIMRDLACYLAKRHTPHSWSRLARFFERKDHQTIVNAAERTTTRIAAGNEIVTTAIAEIERRLFA